MFTGTEDKTGGLRTRKNAGDKANLKELSFHKHYSNLIEYNILHKEEGLKHFQLDNFLKKPFLTSLINKHKTLSHNNHHSQLLNQSTLQVEIND